MGEKPLEVYCKCGAHFCIGCDKGPHSPISCERFEQWKVHITKHGIGDGMSSEAWILSNTKPCPGCKAAV